MTLQALAVNLAASEKAQLARGEGPGTPTFDWKGMAFLPKLAKRAKIGGVAGMNPLRPFP